MAPFQESLGQNLSLRTLRGQDDAERFAAFSTLVNGTSEGLTCQCLLRHHPKLDYDDYVLVVDDLTGEVVSSTCLIPWRCRMQGIDLDVAMLEMVVTHPAYRRRGLIRSQIDRYYHPRVQSQSYDLSIIHGIPYYYRQFGYAYALDTDGYDSLSADCIPESAGGSDAGVHLRDAGVEDIPALDDYYQRAVSRLDLYTLRDPVYWRYLIDDTYYPVKMVERDRTGEVAGYIVVRPFRNVRGVDVVESSVPCQEDSYAVLSLLRAYGELRLSWPSASPLVQIARSLGSIPVPVYQWLVRLTDVIGFLRKIGPVLENRLACSGNANLSADLIINIFRSAFVLSFGNGRLTDCKAAGFVDSSMGADGGDLCIPPDAFTRLVMGYRNLDELRDAWPDIVVRQQSRRLLDVLFPKLNAYFCVPYHYGKEA